MAVTYYEVEGFPKEFIDDNITGTKGFFNPVRKLRCAWSDRIAIINELWYAAYPYAVGFVTPIATKFTCEPYPKSAITGSPGPTIAYDDALVTAYYTTDRYQSGAEYYSEEWIPDIGYDARMEVTGLMWESTAGTPLVNGEGPIFGNRVGKYAITFFKLAAIPNEWIVYQNTVNSGTFNTKSLGLTFAQDTMLYELAQIKHSLTLSGFTQYTARLEFTYTYRNGYGWQGVWRPETAQFEPVYTGSGQALVYPRSAFTF